MRASNVLEHGGQAELQSLGLDMDWTQCHLYSFGRQACTLVLHLVLACLKMQLGREGKPNRAATAVARQWLDWMPPIVMSVSAPLARASAMLNSSFLTCTKNARSIRWTSRHPQLQEKSMAEDSGHNQNMRGVLTEIDRP